MSASRHPSLGDPMPTREPVVVLGEFDGFHLGHRHLLEAAARVARLAERPLVAVVFDVGRDRVLHDQAERSRALLRYGVSQIRVLAVPLDSVDATDVADSIVAGLDPGLVVMACAPDGIADEYPDVRAEFRTRGVDVVEVDRVVDHAGPVTAERVRTAVETGDIAAVIELTGEPYPITGIVQRGQQLGRTIGFPTANLEPPADRVIPAKGVYAAHVRHDGVDYLAAVNVGVRPTVDASDRLVIEAHLLGVDIDLYDQRIAVSLTHRVRDEHRFESLDALTEQLARDVNTVRHLNP
ncbi:MAG: riboflavin kinase [Ilumatobacter fluminis]|uniref:riboflavin kinase n=1 Tax=Ilumatobacter fluminis TaxID=467091 RepID=UPI0032EFEB09